VLATSFTGRYHFGADRPFLTAPAGEPIRLGAAEVRLLAAGGLRGAAQLHFRGDEGALLYTVGLRLSGTSLAQPARFLGADVWVLRMDAPPGDGVPWSCWLDDLAELVAGETDRSLRVAEVWLAAELAAGLAERLGRAPRLDASAQRLARWRRGGSTPTPSGDGPEISLGDVPPDAVILGCDEGEKTLPVPAAPGVAEIRAAAIEVEAREILLAGVSAPAWDEALVGCGLPVRILGDGPRRLL